MGYKNTSLASLSRRQPTASKNLLSIQMAKDKPLSILMVEYTAINQKIALNLFNKLGYKPDVTNSGLDAVDNHIYDYIYGHVNARDGRY